MIVTIDGPAGAGKSSVARGLAERLGFDFLDTGAMYRAVAWAALERGIDLTDAQQIVAVAESIRIEFRQDRILVDGQDVSEQIRTPHVTEHVRFAAGNNAVRAILGTQQRQIGLSSENLVTEGRDQGTTVFPQAQCKIFLTATPETRARRRAEELKRKGQSITYEEVLASQNLRDEQDQSRSVGPLSQAQDAMPVYTDDMDEEQVLTHLEWVVRTAIEAVAKSGS